MPLTQISIDDKIVLRWNPSAHNYMCQTEEVEVVNLFEDDSLDSDSEDTPPTEESEEDEDGDEEEEKDEDGNDDTEETSLPEVNPLRSKSHYFSGSIVTAALVERDELLGLTQTQGFERFDNKRVSKSYLTMKNNVTPSFPQLVQCSSSDIYSTKFHTSVFWPFLDQIWVFLCFEHSKYVGSERQKLMMSGLRDSVQKAGNIKLTSLVETSTLTGAVTEFSDLIKRLKKDLKMDDRLRAQAHLQNLLKFRRTSGDSTEVSFHKLLKTYEQVSGPMRAAHEHGIMNVIMGLIKSDLNLWQGVIGCPVKVFLSKGPLHHEQPRGEKSKTDVLGRVRACMTDGRVDSNFLLCVIDWVLEKNRLFFGEHSPFGLGQGSHPIIKVVNKTDDIEDEVTPDVSEEPVKKALPPKAQKPKFNRYGGKKLEQEKEKNNQRNNQKKTNFPTRKGVKKISDYTLSNMDLYRVKSIHSSQECDMLGKDSIKCCVDTGNAAKNVFPFRLKEFCPDFVQKRHSVGGLGSNSTPFVGSGHVYFKFPCPGESSLIVKLHGIFMDEDSSMHDDEVTLARDEQFEIPCFETPIVESKNDLCAFRLRRYPDQQLLVHKSSMRCVIEPVEPTSHIPTLKCKRIVSRRTAKQLSGQVPEVSANDIPVVPLSTETLLGWCDEVEINLGNHRELMTVPEIVHMIHVRLGHPDCVAFNRTLKAYGLYLDWSDIKAYYKKCRHCKLSGRDHHEKVDQSITRGCLAQQDLTQFSKAGSGGYKYLSVIIDTSTKYIDVFNCKSKIDAIMHASNFLRKNPHITNFRVDGAGELNGAEMKGVMQKFGVGIQGAAPGASGSLGGVERANRTIKDKVLKFMLDLMLETRSELWPWFTGAAACAVNHTVRSGCTKTPSQLRLEAINPGSTVECETLPKFGFGDSVLFFTPREPSKGDSEGLANNWRSGIFLCHVHTGEVQVLSIQNSKVVLFLTHSTNVKACGNPTARIRTGIVKYMLKTPSEALKIYDDTLSFGEKEVQIIKAVRARGSNCGFREAGWKSQACLDLHDKVLSCEGFAKRAKLVKSLHAVKQLDSFVIKGEWNRELLNQTGASFHTVCYPYFSEDVAAHELTLKPTGNIKGSPEPTHSQLFDIHQRDILLKSRREQKYWIVVGKPMLGMVKCQFYDKKSGCIGSFAELPFTFFTGRYSRPLIISRNEDQGVKAIIFAKFKGEHAVDLKCKRTHGTFHLKYGYVAEDEAPLNDVLSGRFNEADLKEFQSIIDNGVFGPAVTLKPGVKACRTRFRRTYKLAIRVNDPPKPKCRFLVCETNDTRDVEITTEMPSSWIRRLVVTKGLSDGFKSATIDVKTAFLLVPLPPEHGDIYVKLPDHLPECILSLPGNFRPGQIRKLNKSLYGLKEAPRLFNEFLANKLSGLGWNVIVSGVFEKIKKEKQKDGSFLDVRVAYLIAYVDDLLCMSRDPKSDLEEVASILQCADLLEVNSVSQRHVGLQITATATSFFFDINSYIKDMPDYEKEIDQLGDEYKKCALSPTTNLPLFEYDETDD